jgi:pimeloyl-ACP methyl ester carboxylesterase
MIELSAGRVRPERMIARLFLRAVLSAVMLVSTTASGLASAADESAPQRRPVKVIAPERIKIKTTLGEAIIPAFASGSVDKPNAGITRAVIMLHGRLRDADRYFDLAKRSAAASGASADTIIIAPQLLSTGDAARHNLDPNIARWNIEALLGGEAAKAPFALSSFEVIDGIIAVLSDRNHFPNLERIVVAGHSGGAQIIQRYAVVGRADQVLAKAGLQPYADGMDPSTAKNTAMRLRYVVANPSTYVYFDATRPHPNDRCADVNRWRYGVNDPVAYVQGDMKALEQRYMTRRVIYLLGGSDTDPHHSALDKTCMAEAQGVHRLERGNAYFAHVTKRAKTQNITLRHTRIVVPGVAHDADRMFNSACGKSALFDAPGCEMKLGESMTAGSGSGTALVAKQ